MKINLEKSLRKKELEYIMELARMVHERSMNAFLIGGMVRDIILKRETHDIDITIDGDVLEIATDFAERFGGRVVQYEKFLTASVFIGEDSVDFATLRQESYEKPGDLPTVRRGSFEKEIFRRDFTINTLALNLSKEKFGELVDLQDGLKDLRARCIRILHKNSFIDDPTRIFRAARFAGRFGYVLEKESKKALKEAIHKDVFKTISPQRIGNELALILKEEAVMDILKFMRAHGILKKTSPFIHYNRKTCKILRGLISLKNKVNRELYIYIALLYQTKKENLKEVLEILCLQKMPQGEIWKLDQLKKDFNKLEENYSNLSNFEIYKTLGNYSKESIFVIKASGDYKKGAMICRRYFLSQKREILNISGREIKELGVKPGKLFGILLEKIKEKKINGEIKTRKEEILFLKKEIKNLALD